MVKIVVARHQNDTGDPFRAIKSDDCVELTLDHCKVIDWPIQNMGQLSNGYTEQSGRWSVVMRQENQHGDPGLGSHRSLSSVGRCQALTAL